MSDQGELRRTIEDTILPLGPIALARFLDSGVKQMDHQALISTAFSSMAPDSYSRLAISLPPRVGKSMLAAQWGVFWWLLRNPTHRVIMVAYSDDLAVQHGKAVRTMVDTYGHIFGIKCRVGDRSVKDWATNKGGGIRSVSVTGGVTGHKADMLVCDDLIKGRDQADDPAHRAYLMNLFYSDLYTRLEPGAPVVMIGTRWHPLDVIGRMYADEPDLWEFISIPAIAGEDDLLGRDVGVPLLHPGLKEGDTERALKHWSHLRDHMPVREWEAQYMCNPSAGSGLMFSEIDWDRAELAFDPDVELDYRTVTIDPAAGGSDECGIVAGGVDDDGRIVVTHDETCDSHVASWSARVVELAHHLDAQYIVYESNLGHELVDQVIREAWRQLAASDPNVRLSPPPLEAVHSMVSKTVRAEPTAQRLKAGSLVICPGLTSLRHECMTWHGVGRSPNRLDALAHLVWFLRDVATPRPKLPGS